MKIEVTDEQKQKIWEELISEAKEKVINIPPTAKTKSQFMEETGMTDWQSDRFLKLQVSEGKLKVIRYRNALYYYPA